MRVWESQAPGIGCFNMCLGVLGVTSWTDHNPNLIMISSGCHPLPPTPPSQFCCKWKNKKQFWVPVCWKWCNKFECGVWQCSKALLSYHVVRFTFWIVMSSIPQSDWTQNICIYKKRMRCVCMHVFVCMYCVCVYIYIKYKMHSCQPSRIFRNY